MYSHEERMKAVELYIKYDLGLADAIRELGYSSRNMLARREWIDALALGNRKSSIRDGTYVWPFSQDQKKDAVIELCTRARSAASIAAQTGTSRTSLYKWKRRLLDERGVRPPFWRPAKKGGVPPFFVLEHALAGSRCILGH